MIAIVFLLLSLAVAQKPPHATTTYPTSDEEGTLISLGDSAAVPISPNGPRARRLVAKSFHDDINTRSRGPYIWVPVKILSATAQLVNGAQYEFKVVGGESYCPKGTIDESVCQYRPGGRRAIFSLIIYEKNLRWTENTPVVFRSFAMKDRDVEPRELFQ